MVKKNAKATLPQQPQVGNKWRVKRTFEDFERLHRQLASLWKEEHTFTFVSNSRTIFLKKKASLKTVTERRDCCQDLLDRILQDEVLASSGVVLRFLEVKSRHGSVNFAANYSNEMNSWLQMKQEPDTIWKPRFLVVKGDLLYYFKDDLRSGNMIEPLGIIPISRCVVTDSLSTSLEGRRVQQEKPLAFKVASTIGYSTIYLSPMPQQKNAKQLKGQWISILKHASGSSKFKFDFCRGTGSHTIHKNGHLTKLGEKVQNWKQRYFCLENNILSYFKTEDSPNPIGRIDLSGSLVRLYSNEESTRLIQKEYAIAIDTPKRKWWLVGTSQSEMEQWERLLLQCSFIMKGTTRVLNASSSLSKIVSIANDGDIIVVEPGIYKVEGVEITKSITIKAADTYSRPVFETSHFKPILTLKSKCIVIDNILFKATKSDCIHVESGNVAIHSCDITSKGNTAIKLAQDGLIIMSMSNILGCGLAAGIEVRGGRIYLDRSNVCENQTAISILDSAHCEINNCCISENNTGLLCDASSNTRLHIQRSKIYDNLSSGIDLRKIPEVLRIFDNSICNNRDVAIKMEQELKRNRKLQESILDNIIQSNNGETDIPARTSLAEYITGKDLILRFDILDIEIIVHILQFLTFPIGQCLSKLHTIWMNCSDEVYEQYESILLRNLFGYKCTLGDGGERINSDVVLLYPSLDLSVSEDDIDLFLPFNNGIIPTLNVRSLVMNELWIEKHGLRILDPLRSCLASVTVNHCTAISDEEMERVYSWLDCRESLHKSAYLDLAGTTVSMKALGKLRNIKVLKLRPIYCQDNETESLNQFMNQAGSTLENLELSYYPLGVEGARTIFANTGNCKRIVLMGVGLGKRQFEEGHVSMGLTIRTASVFETLLENNAILTHLNVKDNIVGDEAVEFIARLPNLRYLNMEECGLTSKSMNILLKLSKSIEHLNLAVNMIDDQGLDRNILEENTRLRSLNLSFNTLITSDGFCNLIHSSSIHTLIVHGCAGQVTDSVVQKLCGMHSLTSLHVSGNELTHTSLICLGQSKLTHLDASYNFITDEGAILLAQHLHIRSVSLASNKLTWIGARELFQSKTIERLDLSQNIDIDDSTESTFQPLLKNQVLRHLDLANNEGIRKSQTLEVLLTKNRTLQSINLRGTSMSSEFVRLLAQQKLEINPNLRQLDLPDDNGSEILLSHLNDLEMKIFVS